MILFDLELRSALHVGEFIGIEREFVQSYVPSDTLFSACVMAWRGQAADVSARLAACRTQPPALVLTSAFPRAGGLRLYPMPLGIQFNASRALDAKQRKRIKWVSESLFKRLTGFQSVEQECTVDRNLAQRGSVWLAQSELAQLRDTLKQPDGDVRLWAVEAAPRVTIDRADSRSNLFHTGRLSFTDGCGLWCMAQGTHVSWIHDALLWLQDVGIGGLRSVGHGAYTLTAKTAADVAMPATGYAVTLSRYAPADAAEIERAVQAPKTAYSLVTVGGWCQDDAGKAWRRKSVRMIAEGSIIGAAARGHIVDVAPDQVMTRPVCRYGLAFNLPVSETALAVVEGGKA
jgi:CRISPR-associated protein Csm4